MAESEEIIQLQIEDEFPVIRRYLTEAKADRVYLITPPGCVGLKGEVQLRLLSRVLADAPFRLALVTSDWSLFKRAERTGIPAFLSLEQAQAAPRQKWARPQHYFRPILRPRWRARRTTAYGQQRGEVKLLSILGGGLTLLSFSAVILFLPKAEVVISPVTIPIEENFTIVVDPQAGGIDQEELTIPGYLMGAELLGKEGMPTTAYKDQPSTTAQGEVLFINLTSDPVLIPQGTVVSTSGGTYTRFQTQSAADLSPGYGQQARVSIAAVEPGPAGNVPPLAINRVEGFLSFRVRVINNQPTEGGTAKQVPYVTLEDKNILKGRLMQRLWQEGFNNLSSQLAEQILLPGYPELIVLAETYDHAVGDEAGALNLELRVLARGLAVRQTDLSTLALSLVEAQTGPEIQVLSQGMEFTLGEPREEDGRVLLPLIVRAQSVPRLDQGLIKGGLVGKTIPQALDYLAQELNLSRDPQVAITPAGWPFMPWLSARIQIFISPGGG